MTFNLKNLCSSPTAWLFSVEMMLLILLFSIKNDYIVFQNRLFSITSLTLRLLKWYFWTVFEDLSSSYVGAYTKTYFRCFFP